MPKRFDCEDEPNEFMEAPCRCDCGNWFDLHDGHRSEKKPNQLVCRECKEDEQAFHLGDEVRFNDEFKTNGRTRAYYGDKGTIVNKHGAVGGKTSVKVNGKKYPIHNVPIEYLEKML